MCDVADNGGAALLCSGMNQFPPARRKRAAASGGTEQLLDRLLGVGPRRHAPPNFVTHRVCSCGMACQIKVVPWFWLRRGSVMESSVCGRIRDAGALTCNVLEAPPVTWEPRFSGAGLAGVLPGLGLSMIRGPCAGRQLGQAVIMPVIERVAPALARHGTRPGEVAKAMEPTAPAATYAFSCVRRLMVVRAARAPAGLERDGGRSAGPAGGRAACGERSEPP